MSTVRDLQSFYNPRWQINPKMTMSDLEQLVRSTIGIHFFVENFEAFQALGGQLKNTKYTQESWETRLNAMQRIFEEGLQWSALEMIMDSKNLDEATHRKAENLFYEHPRINYKEIVSRVEELEDPAGCYSRDAVIVAMKAAVREERMERKKEDDKARKEADEQISDMIEHIVSQPSLYTEDEMKEAYEHAIVHRDSWKNYKNNHLLA